jgi:CcmD family protein
MRAVWEIAMTTNRKMLRIGFALCVALVLFTSGATVRAWQPPPQDGFVPVEQLGNQEQLPATPLVAAAYGVAWGAVLLYVWTIWRRLTRVERELAEVSRKVAAGARR